MEELKDKTISRIKKNKKNLEDELNIEINIKGNRVIMEGDELDKFVSRQVIRALDRNFKIGQAILLKEKEYHLEDIPIKEFTKRKDLKNVKSRIIGRNAKTIKLLNKLSDCFITLHDNTVSILGPHEKIESTIRAVKKLIQGSEHSKVYNYLEKERRDAKNRPQDIGLRESFKEKMEEIKEKN